MSAAAAKKMTMGRVTIAVDRGADADVVSIEGEMDDQATLSDLADQLGKKVVVDLGAVRFINSVGVREWIIFLRTMAERGTKVILRNASEPMVHQMNMVVEARGQAQVESFYAPYLCETCADERSVILDVAGHRAAFAAHKMPKETCPECGDEMVFDDFPARYLLFLD
jgi:anti-anti-sigma regulatory factor